MERLPINRLFTEQTDDVGKVFFDTTGLNTGRDSDPRVAALAAVGIGITGWGAVAF